MSKTLSKLLAAEEPGFSLIIKNLEKITGQPGEDVRLQAEISGQVRSAVARLDLDPSDSTGPELFHALIESAKSLDLQLLSTLDTVNCDDSRTLANNLKDFLEDNLSTSRAWLLKKSSAKKLVKTADLKEITRQLNYRSLDSMLKRESIATIVEVGREFNGDAWRKKLLSVYKSLKPVDFEDRRLELAVMPMPNKHNMPVTCTLELGQIDIWPTLRIVPGQLLYMLCLVQFYANLIKQTSSYWKFNQLSHAYGDIFSSTLRTGKLPIAEPAGFKLGWGSLYRYCQNSPGKLPQQLAHLTADDFVPSDILMNAASSIPGASIWVEHNTAGAVTDQGSVSLNLLDVAGSLYRGDDYAHRSTDTLKNDLSNELFYRYLQHSPVREQVLAQVESSELRSGSIGTFGLRYE